jgi:hypothetical protein
MAFWYFWTTKIIMFLFQLLKLLSRKISLTASFFGYMKPIVLIMIAYVLPIMFSFDVILFVVL